MVTEVFTRRYCDPHAVREEKVEATESIQFAWEGTVREIDACLDCFKEHEARFEPLVDYSRPVKRRRAKKAAAPAPAEAESTKAAADSGA